MNDKIVLSTEDYEICNKLKGMRFSGMAQALEELFADPNAVIQHFIYIQIRHTSVKFNKAPVSNKITIIPSDSLILEPFML